MPSYHDIEVAYTLDDGKAVRFNICNVDYGYSLELTRVSGWELRVKTINSDVLIASEYATERQLRIYYKGILICGKEPGEATPAVPGVAPTAPIHAAPTTDNAAIKTNEDVPTDGQIRAWWLGLGGAFHGPYSENATIKESQLLPAFRKIMTMARAADNLNTVISGKAISLIAEGSTELAKEVILAKRNVQTASHALTLRGSEQPHGADPSP